MNFKNWLNLSQLLKRKHLFISFQLNKLLNICKLTVEKMTYCRLHHLMCRFQVKSQLVLENKEGFNKKKDSCQVQILSLSWLFFC